MSETTVPAATEPAGEASAKVNGTVSEVLVETLITKAEVVSEAARPISPLIEMQLQSQLGLLPDDEVESIRTTLIHEEAARTSSSVGRGRHHNFERLNDLFACSKIEMEPPLRAHRLQTPASVHTSLVCNQEVIANFCCLLCHRLVTLPVILNNGDKETGVWPCGDAPFCRKCILAAIHFNGQCPVCLRCTEEQQLVEDTRTERDQRSLVVMCSFREEGCAWQGELRDFALHQNECETRLGCVEQAAVHSMECSGLPPIELLWEGRPQPLSPPPQDLDMGQSEAQEWEQHRLLLEQQSMADQSLSQQSD